MVGKEGRAAASLGRGLFFAGLAVATLGLGLRAGGHIGLGRRLHHANLPPSLVPGDITVRRGSLALDPPLATGLLVSVAPTVLLNLFLRRWRREAKVPRP